MQLSIIGIDLGKTSCSLVGVNTAGKVLVRRRMRRDTVVTFCSKYPGSIIAKEVCCGAHHIGRTLAAKGFEIRLMSLEYVRPYVKALWIYRMPLTISRRECTRGRPVPLTTGSIGSRSCHSSLFKSLGYL